MPEPFADVPDITPDILVEDLVRLVPEAPALLRRWGLVCVQCGEPVWGTLAELAAAKGVADLDDVLAALRAGAARRVTRSS